MENKFTDNYEDLFTKTTSNLNDSNIVRVRIHRTYFNKLQASYDNKECYLIKEEIIKEYIEFLVSSTITEPIEDFEQFKKSLFNRSNDLISPYYYNYLLEVAKNKGYNLLLGLMEVNILRLESGADSIALTYQILYLLLALLMLLKDI